MANQTLPKSSEAPRRYRFDTSILSEVSQVYRLRLAEERDSAWVNELREDAYGSGDDFQILDLTPVLWNRGDARALVLVVEKNGVAVASMRATVIYDADAAVNHLDAPWPKQIPFIEPVMVLERAATRPEFRRLGLNSLLRYAFLKMASAAGMRMLVGSLYANASRASLMEAMGYRFFPLDEDHDNWLVRASAPRVIGLLDLATDGARALSVLQRKLVASKVIL